MLVLNDEANVDKDDEDNDIILRMIMIRVYW